MVDPDTGNGASKRIRGQNMRFIIGVSFFEEFAEDEGLIKSFAFVFDCGYETLGIDVCWQVRFVVTLIPMPVY